MNVKTLNVFYGGDFLPYKDKERAVHYPVIGSDFQGANDISEIHFYIDRVCGTNNTFAVAIKLPNGKLGSMVLSPATYDSALNEHYVVLPINQFITQMVGGVTISLKAYQGDIELEYDDETELYSIPNGTPIIASTGVIKLNVNYSTTLVGGDLDEEIDIQQLLGLLSTKLNIVDGIAVLNNISTADLSDYGNGQLLYDRYTDTYYRKVATSPYYEKVDDKGVLGAPNILCRLNDTNVGVGTANETYKNNMFVYNVGGKDYLFLTSEPSTFTAVAFDIQTRRTFIRSGMQGSDTLDSVVNSTYEVDLDLGNRYVKTAGVKIGDIYHTIELVGGNMVIGSGIGNIWIQPNNYAKYITSRGEGDAQKVEQYEIANADFVLDQCLDISNVAVLYEGELAYASRPNSVLKFDKLIYRYAFSDSTYIYYRCANDEKSTNLSGYDTYALGYFVKINKSTGEVQRGEISFDFYDKSQVDTKVTNIQNDMAKMKKDIDYALKYPLIYGTPTTDTEEEVGLTTSQLPATTLPKGLINYVGGMSQVVNGELVNAPVTSVLSFDEKGSEANWFFSHRKKTAMVDMGTLTWAYDNGKFRASMPSNCVAVVLQGDGNPHGLCADYENVYDQPVAIYNNELDKAFIYNSYYFSGDKEVFVRDTAYNDAQAFKTAMSGKYLVYELETPTATPTLTPTDILNSIGAQYTTYHIPAEVRALDGYGLGLTSSVTNKIDFEDKKFVKKVGIVDMGTLDYTINEGVFMTEIDGMKPGMGVATEAHNVLSPLYSYDYNLSSDITMGLSTAPTTRIWFRNDAFNQDVASFKSAMSGVYLIFELETPVETDISEYIDRDFSNENLIDLYQGGEVEFENESDIGVPYSLTYQYKVE